MRATPRPFARILDDAVVLTRRRPLSTPLLIAAPLAVINAGWASLSSWFATGAAAADPGLLFGVVGALVLAIPLFLAAQMLAYSVLAVAATRRALGRDEPLRSAVRFVLRPRVLLTLLLAGLLTVVSFVALVFPFFVVSGLVSFLFAVMVAEDRFGWDAISRSSSLAWRNPRGLLQTWPLILVLAIHSVFFAISTGLSLAIQAPIQILQQVVLFRETLGGSVPDPTAFSAIVWLQVPLGVLTTFTSLLAAWYLFHCLTLFFLDTRERREATSLERVIAAWSDPLPASATAASAAPAPPPPPQVRTAE